MDSFTIGGLFFGLCCGFICVFALNRINNELKIEITMTFGITYLVFYIADAELNTSAVVALTSMGLYMAKHKYCISSNVQSSMSGAWQIMIFVVNILTFTLSGLILAHSFIGVETNVTSRDIGISLVLYLLIHASRVLTVSAFHPLITWSGMSLTRKECVVFAWSGLRGRTALILVLLIYLDTKIDRATRERFLFHISMIVLLTLIVNGTSSKFLVRMLGLHKGTPESQSVLLQALKHIRHQTSKQINKMKEDINFANVNWKILYDYLPEKLLEEFDEEHSSNVHQRLSIISRKTFLDPSSYSAIDPSEHHDHNRRHSDQFSTQSIVQVDFDSTSNERHILDIFFRTQTGPTTTTTTNEIRRECHQTNMRFEIIRRFLTAMSVDYEKQWYLGMIRRRALKILLETVEEAKTKLSLKRHWQLLVKHFCMPLYLRFLMKFNQTRSIHRIVQQALFDHLVLTIELTLGNDVKFHFEKTKQTNLFLSAFHSAQTRMENMLKKFPEFANIDSHLIGNVLDEAKMLQLRSSLVLQDLLQSYKNCWTMEMTKRCAQMLLKYESVTIVQLYETGMLNEHEYTHILKFIQKKLFELEYGYVTRIPKIHLIREQEEFFSNLSLFTDLSTEEKYQYKDLLESHRKWFQPGEILLRKDHAVSEAYFILRGIVECSEDLLTCYRSGHIIGIELLSKENLLYSTRTYRAESSIVEVYAIDWPLMQIFLSNKKILRLIYNEIALHTLINMYRQPIHLLNYAQIKVLLDEHAKFYRTEIDDEPSTIRLKRNERLFLLQGTIQREDDDELLNSPQIITVNHATNFQLNVDQSCVAYAWSLENEQECLQIVRSFTTSFRMTDSSEMKQDATIVYPTYSGYTPDFIPQHHSLIQVAKSAANASNIQLIPMEIIDLYNENV